MRSLTDTIGEAMTRLGPMTEDRVGEIVEELTGLNLSEEDRLSVLATALAAVASIYHGKHKPVYLEAVRTWALELASETPPPPFRMSSLDTDGPIEDGAEMLVAGLDALFEGLGQDSTRLQDRLVVELALFARLLGAHGANIVHITLGAVSAALDEAAYVPGRAVRVAMSELALPLTRDTCLATVMPRGMA